jgi:hypothetical protein
MLPFLCNASSVARPTPELGARGLHAIVVSVAKIVNLAMSIFVCMNYQMATIYLPTSISFLVLMSLPFAYSHLLNTHIKDTFIYLEGTKTIFCLYPTLIPHHQPRHQSTVDLASRSHLTHVRSELIPKKILFLSFAVCMYTTNPISRNLSAQADKNTLQLAPECLSIKHA